MSAPFRDEPVHACEVAALLSTVDQSSERVVLPEWARNPTTAAQFTAAIYLVGYPHVSLEYDKHGYVVAYRGIRLKTDIERAGEGRST